jgi:hypothetical protein
VATLPALTARTPAVAAVEGNVLAEPAVVGVLGTEPARPATVPEAAITFA